MHHIDLHCVDVTKDHVAYCNMLASPNLHWKVSKTPYASNEAVVGIRR